MRLSAQRGFTYWIFLFLITVMGLLLAYLGQTWKHAIQREKETELLFIGEQFSKALTSYATHTPPGQQQSPATLEELLEDKRVPYPLHHLRKLYRDPITGDIDWVPVLLNGRIIAIHSASELTPIHTTTLPSWVILQKEGESDPQYRYWLFSRILPQ